MRKTFLALLIASSFCASQAVAGACDWVKTKPVVDGLIDGDAPTAATFKKLAGDGNDSLEVLEDLSTAADRERLRDCRWEAGEYLTKLGFPPLH
jgi:hypothetical protein